MGLVHAEATLIGEKGELYQDTLSNPNHRKGRVYLELLERNSVVAPTTIARREAWEKALPIPKDYQHTDWYISICMARFYELYHLGEIVADYRVHGSNLHTLLIAGSERRGDDVQDFGSLLRDAGARRTTEQRRKKVPEAKSTPHIIVNWR